MTTQLLTTQQHDLERAAELIRAGGLVAIPTETVYGLGANGLDPEAVKADGKAVVVTPEVNPNVVLSARNLPGVLTAPARLINVYDLVNAKYLVIDKAALAVIEEVFA